MTFDWDEAKNQKNIQRHELDFSDAWMIFEQAMLRRLDDRKNYGEERWIALGQLRGSVVVLVYTLRAEKIRIISLRRANRYEREIYQNKTRQPH